MKIPTLGNPQNTIEILQKYVKENGLDIGFAYDGDADRCIAVDENGNVVDGDLILYVCGKYMKEHGQLKDDTIVTTIMSNLGLYKACDKIGMKYEKTQVGDKYVYENMIKNGFMLGGEQSGHIIFSKHARWYSDFSDADGSYHGDQTVPRTADRRSEDLSTASEKCACGR